MKIRRPCIAVLFSVLLALSLIGCGGTSSSPKNGDAANEVQEEPQYKLDNTTDVEAELVSLDSDSGGKPFPIKDVVLTVSSY